MHIPDGFLAPEFYLPAWGAAGLAVARSAQKVKTELNERTLPRLGVFTAAAFLLMSIALPLPYGGTIHATGIPLLAILFGVPMTVLSVTIVLLLQSLLLGEGGITALGLNVLIMGWIGPLTIVALYRLLGRKAVAVFVSSAAGILVMALTTALSLGLQPLIATDAAGRPLFFPLALDRVVPAVLIPHVWLAVAESLVTVWIVRSLRKMPGLSGLSPEEQDAAKRSVQGLE